jgi:hypothetical protein
MTFQCFQLAAAAFISFNAWTLHAQSMRVADMETGTAITSLTKLQNPSHPLSRFGAIDANASGAVTLDILVAPDLTSAEFTNQLQSQRAPRPSLLSSMLSQAVPLGTLLGKNPADVASPLVPLKAPSLRMPSTQSLQGPSSQIPQAALAGEMTQNGSPSAPHLSSVASGLLHRKDLDSRHLHRRSSGSELAASAGEIAPYGVDAASDQSNAGAAGEFYATSADQKAPQRFFESIKDPFAAPPKAPFEGPKMQLGLERVCGGACFAGGHRNFDDLISNEEESNLSAERSDRNASLQPAVKLNYRLENALGRLSDEASGSEHETARRTRTTNGHERGVRTARGMRHSAGSEESSK